MPGPSGRIFPFIVTCGFSRGFLLASSLYDWLEAVSQLEEGP